MEEAEFDKFADEYHAMHAASISASGEGPEYFAEYKIADISRECELNDVAQKGAIKILDFGAGNGSSVPYVRKYFPVAELYCLDVSKRSLELAEGRFPSQAHFTHFDGTHIPFPDEHIDIAFAACVFHHIDESEHIPLLRELHRVIKPGGSLFVFEHNPYNPLTVRVVNSCQFDENACLIKAGDMKKRVIAAGFVDSKIRYRVFFPHAFRVLRHLERAMIKLPLGGQYYSLSRK